MPSPIPLEQLEASATTLDTAVALLPAASTSAALSGSIVGVTGVAKGPSHHG